MPARIKVDPESIARFGQGFRAGYNRLKPHQRVAVRDILYSRGLARQYFYKLLNGQSIPKVTTAAHIADVFARFGIEDPWGSSARHAVIPRKKDGGQDNG